MSMEPMIATVSASICPLLHEIEPLKMGEAGRADATAIGLVGAVGHKIDAEFALGRLDRRIGLARRYVIALGVELEVVDQGFHRPLHLSARRRGDLMVVHLDGPIRRHVCSRHWRMMRLDCFISSMRTRKRA